MVTPTPPLDPSGRARAAEPDRLHPVPADADRPARRGACDHRRAAHHQRCGLPTDQSQAVTNSLDLALFTAPVLRGASGLAIPVPRVAGYALSFLDVEQDSSGHPEWVVTPDVAAPADSGDLGLQPAASARGLAAAEPDRARLRADRRQRQAGGAGRPRQLADPDRHQPGAAVGDLPARRAGAGGHPERGLGVLPALRHPGLARPTSPRSSSARPAGCSATSPARSTAATGLPHRAPR